MSGPVSAATSAEAARHVKGATIAWGGGRYFDFDDPDANTISLEDYAFALAYTVRWRGQARSNGRRVFYGVAEHCVRGAIELIGAGYSNADALAFLMHESDEVPLPDLPGPVKSVVPGWRYLAGRCAAAIDLRFRVVTPDPDLIKRWDIRMLMTERRDLLGGHEAEIWDNGGSGGVSTEGYDPLPTRIVPYDHPTQAALAFMAVHRRLGGFDPGEAPTVR